MSNSTDDLTGIKMIRQGWPMEDPAYNTQRVIEAAAAISELWAYLRSALAGNNLLADCSTAVELLSGLATASSRAWDVLDGMCLDLGSTVDPDVRSNIRRSLDSAAYAQSVAQEDLSHAAGWVAHSQQLRAS
ncbi:hypothetical protein [Nocardia carnea]|uniref:hypothetical protein n=1 Tax=Nocardia carnea TaxID=37328 RepID=UPI002455211A|nr:hypothetical protein [Nocardia carnea]